MTRSRPATDTQSDMSSATPLPPSQDPWYLPPPRFDTAQPGNILRLRLVPGVKPSDYENCAAVYHVMFATRNSRERPSWGVTTLLVPQTTDGHALLSYQIPYNTACPDTGPSFMFHQLRGGEYERLAVNLEEGVRRGWYVNFPDFEGPHAAFGDPVTHGYTLLDSLRAVLHLGFAMDVERTRVCLWGFSGGSLASCWAAQFQPRYAPELKCVGAVLGALPGGCSRFEQLSETPFAGLLPIFFVGVGAYYPAVQEYVVSELKEARKDEFLAVRGYSVAEAFRVFGGKDIWGFFKSGREVFHHPLIRDRVVHSRVGYDGPPQMPIFFHKAIHDQLTPIEDTDTLVERWSKVDVNMLYERNTVGDHLTEALNGRARAIKWMEVVLDGTYTHKGVTIRDVTVDDSRAVPGGESGLQKTVATDPTAVE